MKKIILFIFIFTNLVFSTPLFIQETPIKTYIKNRILKEAEKKGDEQTIYELTNENKLIITNNNIITNNTLIITNDIDFSRYKERGYDITMDVLPRYYTVRKGDTLFKISSYTFIYGEKNFWTIIYNANKNLIKNTSSLPIGLKLFIPSIRGETRYWTYEPKLEYVPFKMKMDLTSNMYQDYPFIIKTKDD
ncbi:LysM peptidoglycan-binding domain-containing protein [Brachyspira alvinipulli]|uniref:LysM peptidoglycan-binding domain-containing protein n=1 Tax=Brachyspira alvinipulli TaxID=84379 RepID=UPI0004B7F8C4|nr:LysM peptidoglycan-binding domain-containing protein [Brachyspira alvinipulli]